MEILGKNKRATYDYEVISTYISGIELLGPEVKSIIERRFSLAEAYIKFDNDNSSIYIWNMHINRYKYSNLEIDEYRNRRLLLTKREIKNLNFDSQSKGLTIIPLELIYSDNRKIKIKLALARGKKTYEKRDKVLKKQYSDQII